jgi:hypothetical protein
MKGSHTSAFILSFALATMAASAYGQQPPDVVTSDTNFNTAMGSQALSGLRNGGVNNTAAGAQALAENEAGSDNTAFGANALYINAVGNENTASGFYALYSNYYGSFNTANGGNALYSNISGQGNTASGFNALYASTSDYNTASGFYALYSGKNVSRNNAIGAFTMYKTNGDDNDAMGYAAMYTNTTGKLNNAVGSFALYYLNTGTNNNAFGYGALYGNSEGSNNIGVGFYALEYNEGNNNIAIGSYAGANLTNGSGNIDIASRGVAGESSVIRVGTPSAQLAVYVAGIANSKVTGGAVYVTSTGQLGVMASSERYKTAIAAMGANSAKLLQLRPVTFRLKTDPNGVPQYGLIAEEVAKIYPELVIRDAAGTIEGLRYEELAPMLLNEMQEERRAALLQKRVQDDKIAAQAAQLQDMKHELAQMQLALLQLQSKDERVAQR